MARELFIVKGEKEPKADLSDLDTRHVCYESPLSLFVKISIDSHYRTTSIVHRTDSQLSFTGHRKMAELVNAYISWQVCEMHNDMRGNLLVDQVYPVPALPRVRP